MKESIIKGDSKIDVNILINSVLERLNYRDYFCYEKNGKWLIGFGIDMLIDVKMKSISISKERKIISSYQYDDFSVIIEPILNKIEYKKWRAFGYSCFELLYKNYNIEINMNDDLSIAKIFVPKIEVEVVKCSIFLKSRDELLIDELKNVINTIIKGKKNKSILQQSKKILSQNDIQQLEIKNYRDNVEEAVSRIKKGEFLKITLSREIIFKKRINMIESFFLGFSNNQPNSSFLFCIEDQECFGFSPETILKIDRERKIETNPLAGTRPIGSSRIEEDFFEKELLSDPKEIYEHSMTVKMAYDELKGLVSENTTVCFPQFFKIYKRGSVQHLGSVLEGRLKENLNIWHAFSELVPALTVTGGPKKKTAKVILEMEAKVGARLLYGGSVFIVDNNNQIDVSLILRSVFQNSNKSWTRCGAGIISSSIAKEEEKETENKILSVINYLVPE